MTKSVDLFPSIVIFSKVDEHDPGIRLAQATNFGLRSDMSTSVPLVFRRVNGRAWKSVYLRKHDL